MNKTHLALFAGLIASDGHLDKDYYGVRFITSDKKLLNKVINLISDEFKFKVWETKSGFGRKRHILYLYDKGLKNILK